MNVGDIRRRLVGLPDDAPVVVAWTDGPPGDDEPRVTIDRFDKGFDVVPNLTVWVSLEHLDDEDYEDEDDICEECGIRIPVMAGFLENVFHAESCSLYTHALERNG